MNITFKNKNNIENKRNRTNLTPIPYPLSVSFKNSKNSYEERPLKQNMHDLSFKGLSSIKVSDAVKMFEKEVGTSAAEHFNKTIEKVLSAGNTGVRKLEDGRLQFDEDSFRQNFHQAIIDPIVYFPIDIANSFLGFLKKVPGFKNSKTVDNLLKTPILKNRIDKLETYSNTMAIKHCFEMLGDKKIKNSEIFNEAQKRFKIGQTPYTVKGERSLTRLVSGLIPAFFLANDAYNLSMYMNNNKDLAKKEKKRRFNQELTRVIVTAGATFGALGFFAKKVSSDPAVATGIIAALTFGSELIGRMLVGTPVYPLDKEGAKKYAKLQNKDNSSSTPLTPALSHKGRGGEAQSQDKETDTIKSGNKEDKPKSNYVMKLLGGMVLAGFLIDKRNSIKPIRKIVNNLTSRYTEFFAKDYTISKKEFDLIVTKLRENGFEKLAKHYKEMAEEIIEEGNLTAKELLKVEREFNDRLEKFMPDEIIWDDKKLKEAKNKAEEKLDRDDIIKSFNFAPRNNDIINISGDVKKLFKEDSNVNKTKDNIINGVLAIPIKFAWEILNMPYKYVVKPLIEIPLKGKELLSGKEKAQNYDEIFRNGVEYLRKNINSPDFKKKVNKNIIDAFDNVNKSNISSAELAGSAKVAVSTATSAFLILDNYNMVMIDSQGKDKDLAEQKAKERTIQRIVRIAYGAVLIKFFSGLFKSPYDASLLGAEAVTAGNCLITETLERTSVGMPLHEATREEIIEKDNEALNATGLKGAYFRFMSKLTGKKPLSENKAVDK